MNKNKEVDWQTTADILDDVSDEDIERANKILNPSGMSAGEEVEYALKQFQAMGLIPMDDDEDDEHE
jgi:hypothetical protein